MTGSASRKRWSTFDGVSVPGTVSGSLFHFPRRCRIGDFRIFINISHTVTGRFSWHTEKWLMPTTWWIHNIVEVIWHTSISKTRLIWKLDSNAGSFFVSLLKCGLTAPKVAEIGFFKYNFGEKGYTPLSNVYQIWLGEEVRPLHPHSKFHHCVLKNVGLQPPKSPKLVFFGINLPKRGMPLKRFLQNLAWGRESQVCTLMPNFIVVTFRPAAPSSTAIVGFNISLGTW